ncbi:carboxylesterase 3 isoform X4 [Meriones unguiculatus]|uniref:carboxylesterase 3 isoform X4 n=1 Tax=Meriones unguiculatus TaxID=10047 RepID=UPI00293F0232|nr:carboxylesterase 3 isoform X4 [Meriones unguiculatus]
MGRMVQAGSSVLVRVTCLLLALPATVAGSEVTQPEVDTLLGRVRGRQVGVKGTDRVVNVFLGIPFAQAPLGPLRFSAPLPPQPWEGVRDATTAPPMCMQDVERMRNCRFTLNEKVQVLSMSEDCLILNIYSPSEVTAGTRRPVMVWIHGGSLMVGSATSQDGSALAAYGDVVVVTVQYRLGVFGFLSTGDKHMPGNRGLLDVVAALRWVQGNIAPFGGDPNCVTIFGNSAGAMVVSFLVLSPMSAGLFHRAISQSGVINNMMKEMDTWPVAQSFASSMACSSESPAELVQCLLRKEGRDLTKQQNMTVSYIVNDSFFPQSPETFLTEKQFPTVPYLLGVNNHELGWLILKVWNILDKLEHLSQEDMLEISRPFLALLDVPLEIMPTVTHEYLDNGSDASATRHALQELLGDIMFVIPTLNFSRHLQAFPEATEEEKQLSLTMMAQWSQFAYTGNPNGKGLPPWPQLNKLEQYLEIGLEPRTGVKLKKGRLEFWTETLPRKIQEWRQQRKTRKASEEL